MVNTILYGKPVANGIYDSIKEELKRTILVRKPRLAVIIVGNRPDSELYVKLKKKKAEELGFICNIKRFNNLVCEDEIIAFIDGCNSNKKIDGLFMERKLREHLVAFKIQTYWRRANYNPVYELCKRRLMKECDMFGIE